MTRQCVTSGNARPSSAAQSLALRQLRYHTRSTLQRVLIEIHEHATERQTSRDRCLLEQLANRIQRSVEISDALYGITGEPGCFSERLRTLCGAIVSLFSDLEQHLMVDIAIDGTCPLGLEDAVLRAVHEFVGSAVRHGMLMRLLGRIVVSLTCSIDEVKLVVADDGWELTPVAGAGEALGLAGDLADEFAGSASVERRNGRTVATVLLRDTTH